MNEKCFSFCLNDFFQIQLFANNSKKMNELFQQNVKDYFDKLTIKDFIANINNLLPNPDTEWTIIVSLTVLSYKDKDFKDYLNKKKDLDKSICAGFLDNFKRFHDDPLITGLYYFYKFQITRQRTKLNQIKNYINTQSNRSLKNKLISLAKSFNCYKNSFDSKQTLCHGVSDIISIFTPNSLSLLRDTINSLKASLDVTFGADENIVLNQFKLKDYESDIRNTFSFMYKTCRFYERMSEFKIKNNITLPNDFKTEIRKSMDELDTVINEISVIFEESTLPYIVKIDFFLQCSWLVSLVYSTIAHPPAQSFKESYLPPESSLPPGSFSKLPLDDDEQMEKIIDQMGKKRQLEFEYTTEVLDIWRSELRKFDKRYKKLYFTDKKKQNIVDIIEEKQFSDEGTNDDNETQELVYNFPDEFSSFPNSMNEIKDIIENQIIKFFKSKDGKEETEEQVEEEEEEYEEEEEANDDVEIEEEEEEDKDDVN